MRAGSFGRTRAGAASISSLAVGRLRSSDVDVAFLPSAAVRTPGRIGLAIAPGRRGDLVTDLRSLRLEHDVRLLVTLVEGWELEDMRIAELFERARALGLETLHAPIADFGVPPSPAAALALVRRIVGVAEGGATVVVHCKGGRGRSGTMAACCLVARGHAPADALAVVRAARPGAVENERQEGFVHAFAAALGQV